MARQKDGCCRNINFYYTLVKSLTELSCVDSLWMWRHYPTRFVLKKKNHSGALCPSFFFRFFSTDQVPEIILIESSKCPN
jgi:hypothetical protein